MGFAKTVRSMAGHARMAICILVTLTLVSSMFVFAPRAYAADASKPDSVTMVIGTGDWKEIDVTNEVATLNTDMGKGIDITFKVHDAYSNLGNANKLRELVLEDKNGNLTKLCHVNSDTIGFKSDDLVADRTLKLITSTTDGSGKFVERYVAQLNVRIIDPKPAEKKPTGSAGSAVQGMSEDGGSWSFSNGLSYTFKNTGFSFLDNTTMNLGAINCPSCINTTPTTGDGALSTVTLMLLVCAVVAVLVAVRASKEVRKRR